MHVTNWVTGFRCLGVVVLTIETYKHKFMTMQAYTDSKNSQALLEGRPLVYIHHMLNAHTKTLNAERSTLINALNAQPEPRKK